MQPKPYQLESSLRPASLKLDAARLTSSCLSRMCEHEQDKAAISDADHVNMTSMVHLLGEGIARARCHHAHACAWKESRFAKPLLAARLPVLEGSDASNKRRYKAGAE